MPEFPGIATPTSVHIVVLIHPYNLYKELHFSSDGLEIAIRNHCVERVFLSGLEYVQKPADWRRIRAFWVSLWNAANDLWLGEAIHTLKVLNDKLDTAHGSALPPRSNGFLIKHAIAETYHTNAAGSQHPVDLCKHFLGLLKVLHTDGADDSIEAGVAGFKERVLVEILDKEGVEARVASKLSGVEPMADNSLVDDVGGEVANPGAHEVKDLCIGGDSLPV